MNVTGMKSKLSERIKALEDERSVLLEEVGQLKEIVELSERAKDLENEVDTLKGEVKTLKGKIPRELLEELGEIASPLLEEDEEEGKLEEERTDCDDGGLV